MIKDKIQIRDFTSLAEPSDSVVLVYFEEMEGTVHVYRDGTVVLSSPFGTTVTRLKYAGDRLWRKETFLTILAQMGLSDEELAKTERMVEARDEALSQMGFREAAKKIAAESQTHFRAWCDRHGLDYDAMGEEEIDEWLAARLAEMRGLA